MLMMRVKQSEQLVFECARAINAIIVHTKYIEEVLDAHPEVNVDLLTSKIRGLQQEFPISEEPDSATE